MDDIQNDPRFKHVTRDPRFRQMPKKQRKVKVDKRFQSMFSDKRFKLKYSVDKRGRPIDTSTNENLKKYYELASESSGDDEENDNSDDEENVDNVGKDYQKGLYKKDDSGVEDELVKSDNSEDFDTEKNELIGTSKLKYSKQKQNDRVKLRKDTKKKHSQQSDEENGDTSDPNDQQVILKKDITKSGILFREHFVLKSLNANMS